MSKTMLKVGQPSRNGQHMTRFDNNQNQFNVLNSYFGCNSVYKNCSEYQNIIGFNGVSDRYRQAINGYAYQPNVVPPNVTRFTSFWNDWPTIEESFGTALKPKAQALQWPQMCSTVQPIGHSSQPSKVVTPSISHWTTGFWDNVNKMNELESIQSPDLNDNSIGWKYESESMVTSSNQWNSYGFNNQLHFGYGRSKPPTISRQKRDSDFSDDSLMTDQSFGDSTPMSDESLISLSKMANSWYVPPKIRRRQPSLMECVFCKNNNERPEFYRSHILKDPESNIQCPVLRAYDCPICHNGGGPKAHTIRYCPLNKAGFQSKIENLVRTQKLDALTHQWVDNKKKRRIKKNDN